MGNLSAEQQRLRLYPKEREKKRCVCVCVCVCVSGVRVLSARGACTFEPRFIGPWGAASTLNNQVLHKLAQPPLVLQTACP